MPDLLRLITLLLLSLTTNVLMADETHEMQQAVNAFYNIYIEEQPLGVPTENEQEKFRPHVSSALGKLLQEADETEQKYKITTGGEVPPLVESDLLTSLFEDATAFNVLSCEQQVETGSCLVEFSYIDTRDNSSFQWKDKVYIVRESHDWQVDDIEYHGDWQFMHKGRLQELLRQVIEDGNSTRE